MLDTLCLSQSPGTAPTAPSTSSGRMGGAGEQAWQKSATPVLTAAVVFAESGQTWAHVFPGRFLFPFFPCSMSWCKGLRGMAWHSTLCRSRCSIRSCTHLSSMVWGQGGRSGKNREWKGPASATLCWHQLLHHGYCYPVQEAEGGIMTPPRPPAPWLSSPCFSRLCVPPSAMLLGYPVTL